MLGNVRCECVCVCVCVVLSVRCALEVVVLVDARKRGCYLAPLLGPWSEKKGGEKEMREKGRGEKS